MLGSAIAIFALLALLGLTAGEKGVGNVGTPLPTFTLPLLGGGELSNEDLAGRVTVINVWASWCPPCRSEAPILRRVSEDSNPDRVAFLGVIRNDDPDSAADFVEDYGLRYPNVIDDGSLSRALGVRGIPMTYVVAADGTVTAQHFGPISESRLRVLIEDAQARARPAAAGGDGQ